MNDRVRMTLAVVLVGIGLLCVVYAVIAWRQADNAVPTITPVQQSPADPGESPDDPVPENATPGKTNPDEPVLGKGEAEVDPTPVAEKDEAKAAPVPLPSDQTPKNGAAKKLPKEAHKQLLTLWLLAALPMVFVLLIAIVLIRRWVRPKPMPRTGPSDTTDLWAEAGKRLKIP